MTPNDVSVVIPALNEADGIVAAIESALAAGAGQVIVADGGSNDSTIRHARQCGAEVKPAKRGRGGQIRSGAELAKGSLLLFLHADNRLSQGCLKEVCECINYRGAGPDLFWGGFRQHIGAPGLAFRGLEWGNAARIKYRGMPFGDQAMVVSRTLYDSVGGMPDLPLMEDVALSQRLRKKSWPSLLESHVYVDPRRWEKRGVVRQTARNWAIQVAHKCGAKESRLVSWYR